MVAPYRPAPDGCLYRCPLAPAREDAPERVFPTARLPSFCSTVTADFPVNINALHPVKTIDSTNTKESLASLGYFFRKSIVSFVLQLLFRPLSLAPFVERSSIILKTEFSI